MDAPANNPKGQQLPQAQAQAQTPAVAPVSGSPATPAPAVAPSVSAAPATTSPAPVTPVPVTTALAQKAPAPPSSGAPAAPASVAAAKPQQTPARPGAPLPKDQPKSAKRFILGCVSALGCSLILLVFVLIAFLATDTTDSPIFGFLGVPAGEVVNVLLTLINIIFLVVVFLSFIFVVVGVFKITTARKDDKDARRKGAIFTFISFVVLFLLVISWLFAYFFLASKRTVTIKATPIVTEPEKTTNLTAPIAVTFDAKKAPIDKKKYEILTHEWDFGDKTVLRGERQTHTFTDIGSFKVKLTITLKEKATGKQETREYTKDVSIQNVRASVVIKATPPKGPVPLKVTFDGSDSSSENGEILSYKWDLDADGEFDDGDEATVETLFEEARPYKVTLQVEDSTGALATGELVVEAQVPDTPVAAMTVEGVEGTTLEAGKSYVLSAVESTSPYGTIDKYNWEFGDGEKASTRTVNHTYKEAGDYEITLSVIDTKKKKGSVTKRFNVQTAEQSPIASIATKPEADSGILTGQAPFAVAFDGSKSTDPNNNIVEYAWDFNGDKKTDDRNPVTSYTFTTAGTHNVVLTVTDATDQSAQTQMVVKVEAPGLKADIKAEPVSGSVPLTVTFDASGSSYPEGSIVNYEWDFGDGKSPRTDSAQVSYQYTNIGTFTAKVTAITADNKRASATATINVRAVSVKSCFEPSVESGPAPLTVKFDPTCATGTVVQYRWNFANLGRSTDRKSEFTFRDPGEYAISLEVADADNIVDTFTKKIVVEAKN